MSLKHGWMAPLAAAIAVCVAASPWALGSLTFAAPQGGGAAPARPACRVYVTSSKTTGTTVAPAYSQTWTRDSTGRYDLGANELTGKETYADSLGTAYSMTSTLKFASAADFVGDAPRITMYATLAYRPISSVNSTTGSAAQTVNTTYVYDAQGRLSRMDIKGTTNSVGSSIAQVFSAWDQFGRPTAATAEPGPVDHVYTYDDAARTLTITSRTGVSTVTTTMSFDADGNHTGGTTSVTSAGVTSKITTKTIILSTDKVCR
jgi:YD repeat-containing protein